MIPLLGEDKSRSTKGPGRVVIPLVAVVVMLPAFAWSVRLIGESKLAAARERFETETGSLSLKDYTLPALEDGENAAICLQAGAEALQIPDASGGVMARALNQESGSWSRQIPLELAALIAANQPAFDRLEGCIGLERSSFDFAYEEGFSAALPPMLGLLRVGRLVAIDLRLALAEHDPERASRDLEILDQLSQALARESFLISALLHLGVERLFLGAVRDVIEADLEALELLADLERRVGERPSAGALRRGLAAEAAVVLASWELQDSPTESSSRGDRLLAWLFEPYQVAALLGTYSELVRSLEDPWVDTLERSRSRPTGGRFAPHLFLLPNLLDAVDKLKAIELGQLLARQALTLERRGLETGSLPRSFDDSSLDPYASGSFLYESLSDGRARLSAPAAIELWRSEHPAADGRQKPIFEWTVGSPGGS